MIYKLFKKIFRKRLQNDFKPPEKIVHNPFEIGEKVICIGNEPCSELMIGKIVAYDSIGPSKVPIVEVGDKQFICFGNVCLWTAEKEKAFNKLSWDERYNVVSKYDGLCQNDIDRKNSEEYKRKVSK